MDDKARRKPETVVSVAFERIGRKLESGTGFAASFDEMFAVANIERPMTEGQLRQILDTDETGAFSRDPELAMDIPTSRTAETRRTLPLDQCLAELRQAPLPIPSSRPSPI